MYKKLLAIISTNIKVEDYDSEKVNDVRLYYGNDEDINECDDISCSFKILEEKALLESLEELRSDLFYQIEAKHGAKVAKNYPSIAKADLLIKKLS